MICQLKKTCVRQEVLDKWFHLIEARAAEGQGVAPQELAGFNFNDGSGI